MLDTAWALDGSPCEVTYLTATTMTDSRSVITVREFLLSSVRGSWSLVCDYIHIMFIFVLDNCVDLSRQIQSVDPRQA